MILQSFQAFVLLLLMPTPALASPDGGMAAAAQAIPEPTLQSRAFQPAVFDELMPLFSGVVSLEVAGKTIFSKVAGHADARNNTPNTLNTRFPICSLSKQFASVAVLRLVDQGKLKLDEPIHAYVEGLQPIEKEGKKCTIRNAMNHLCGFDREFLMDDTDHLVDSEKRKSYVAAMNDAELVNTPGTKRLYTNVGYDLLGLLVQDVSGQEYETFLKEQFFEPLGMKDTGIEVPLPVTAPKNARGQIWLKWLNIDAASNFMLPANFASTVGASGNISSTVQDMQTWNRALHTGQILPPGTYAELIAVPAPNQKPKKAGESSGGYGGGIIIVDHPQSVRLIWHNGALVPHNFSTFMGWVPQTQTSLVMLTNHAMFISQETKAGLRLLQWLHGITDDTSSPERPFMAYLFMMVFGIFLVGFPITAFFYIRLFLKGHRKGKTKAFSSLISYTLYTPFFLLVIWGGPVRGPIIFLVFLLVSVGLTVKNFHLFENGLHGLTRGQWAKLVLPHAATIAFVGYFDFLGAALMTGGLLALLAVYALMSRTCLKPAVAP